MEEFDTHLPKDAPLRQGDVLGFWDWSQREPTSRFGVIITADCDIAQERAHDSICYLKIVTLRDYLHCFWAPRRLVANKRRWLKEWTSQTNDFLKARAADTSRLEQTAIERLLNQGRVDDVKATLLQGGLTADHLLIKKLSTIQELVADPPATGSDCLFRVTHAESQWNGSEIDQILTKLTADSRNHLRASAQVVSFISAIPEIDDESSPGSPGYVVLLDQVAVWPIRCISTSFEEVQLKPNEMAYRFGRLRDRYKFAILQQFSFLFQRIGLPDDHQGRMQSAADKIALTLVE